MVLDGRIFEESLKIIHIVEVKGDRERSPSKRRSAKVVKEFVEQWEGGGVGTRSRKAWKITTFIKSVTGV